MIGQSKAFRETIKLITKIAAYDAPVLIEGETGTGKELAARAIHYQGARRDQPFVPVNCGAIPDLLIENEFFGHRKGAFTDARNDQLGLIAYAHSIAPRPSGCATGHPSPPGALGLAASDSFCRDRPALTCATSLSLARKLTQ